MADEFASMINQTEKLSSHPEDTHSAHSSDLDSTDEPNPSTSTAAASTDPMASVLSPPSTYQIPSHTAHANTGPKGVIADARSFARAKREGWRARRSPAPQQQSTSPGRPWYDEKRGSSEGSEEDDDEEFMQRWRNNRLAELRVTGDQVRNRRQSPSMREYGSMQTVDAVGYLDAVEKVGRDTTVVVCIYDDRSEVSHIIESHLASLARKHVLTRFVKLHYAEAEMDVVSVPAVLAYKRGELFANLVSIIDELPSDSPISDEVLETFLRRHAVLD
ncbi:MAG: hypothetical protein M4579_007374 [Chaenotheca gracillima]|nr:MAG: hypothetical protein M4579_007374 [Chaenotheca gracillima]